MEAHQRNLDAVAAVPSHGVVVAVVEVPTHDAAFAVAAALAMPNLCVVMMMVAVSPSHGAVVVVGVPSLGVVEVDLGGRGVVACPLKNANHAAIVLFLGRPFHWVGSDSDLNFSHWKVLQDVDYLDEVLDECYWYCCYSVHHCCCFRSFAYWEGVAASCGCDLQLHGYLHPIDFGCFRHY